MYCDFLGSDRSILSFINKLTSIVPMFLALKKNSSFERRIKYEFSIYSCIILRARQTCLIIVDVQNNFVKPKGILAVPSAAEALPHIQKLLEAARKWGVRILTLRIQCSRMIRKGKFA